MGGAGETRSNLQVLIAVGTALFLANWAFQRVPTVHHYVTDLTITFADASTAQALQQKQVRARRCGWSRCRRRCRW